MIKLQPPLKDFKWDRNISQLFGVNRDLYFSNFGLPGHNGLDFVNRELLNNGYGTPILAAHDGKIIRLNYETKWKSNGNGIYLETEDGQYQSVYWHLSEIQVRLGQEVKAGEVIGLMGNTGFCRPEPTPRNPYAGTHLHFAVMAKEAKDRTYNGFIDPTPLLYSPGDKLPLLWPSDLYIGLQNDYVAWLQTCLKLEGLAEDYEPIGYFGKKTLRDVKQLQVNNNVSPAWGYFGTRTRELVKKYSLFYKP